MGSGRKGPPSPADTNAFPEWLRRQPREWSAVVACRAALRLLPFLRSYSSQDDVLLAVFRAAAISWFASKYPAEKAVTDRAIADAATRAASVARVASTGPAAAVKVVIIEAVARAADAAHGDRLDAARAAAVVVDAAMAAAATVAADAADLAASNAAAANVAVRNAVRAMRKEIQLDTWLLDNGMPVDELQSEALWTDGLKEEIAVAWRALSWDLARKTVNWSVWISWYEIVLHGAGKVHEDYYAAFTDLPEVLPWMHGPGAVNAEIARRLRALQSDQTPPLSRADTLERLAEVASPQPRLASDGRLDVIPNRLFDVPTVDHDLTTLPLRQMNLIKIILSDLPRNAPVHLRASLKSYERELKARGVQPILPLLKDDADIIAAAVHSPRAEDEWLESGQRRAFELFDENHGLFVEHFPLDVERETLYAQTGLDEANASGKDLVEPFEKVAEATQDAHRAGAVTDDFMAVVDKMTELARVLSTQPPAQVPPSKVAPDFKVIPDDRIQPVTTKKRVLLGSLGFYAASLSMIGSLGTIATLNYAVLASRLKEAIEALSRFIPGL